MATASRNPWDADPVAPQQAPWASDPVVSAKNPWDNDPAVAAPAAPQAAPRQPQVPQGDPEANTRKFLDFLAKAEGADYDVVVGGSRFTDFRAHPRVVGLRTKEGPSTAAGRYQITATTYDDIAPKLGITDFSPASQDRIALELIRRKGALEDIRSGNFQAAIDKLGGTWASLPSSPYSQPKKSQEWVNRELGINGSPANSPTPVQFKNFAPVRDNIDQASLNTDQDWLRASLLMYNFWERKPFEGTQDELAEWGKDSLGQFNFNLVSMAEIAAALQNASQEEKEAFLYMMDTYDNTNISWAGAGRAATGILTDPTNLVGIGTLGIGFLGREASKSAAKQSIRQLLVSSLARTGIGAGIQAGVFGAADSTIRQGIEVSAGRREEIDLSKVGVDTAISATAGVVLGTAADAAVSKIVATVKGARGGVDTPRADGTVPDADAVVPPGATGAIDDINVSGVAPTGAQRAADEVIPGVSGRDPNLGSTLTPQEIAEATARQQQGRLAADDIVPNVGDNVPRVNVPEMNTGLRSTPMSMEQLSKLGDEVATQLRPLNDKDLTAALEGVRNASLPFEEMRIVARGVQMYADELRIEKAELIKKINAKPDAPDVPQQQARLDEIEARLGPLGMADDAFGSMAGSILRQRQEGLPGVQGITVESIMRDQNLSKTDAEKVWAEVVGQASMDAEARRISAQYDTLAKEAIDNDDLAGAARAAVLKQRELDARVKALAPNSARWIDKLTELAISNVFSLTTIVINIVPSGVKTLVLPGIRALVKNPFEKATRVEMAASYSAMRSSFMGALRSARAGFKYEQALITRDGVRLVEGEMAMTGRLGAALRIFPRLLNASDEFLSKLNYDSFVAGKAGAEAAIEGVEKGLKGKALDDFIQKSIKEAAEKSLTPVSGDELVQPIINKGLNLGLTGEDLFKYVEREAVKDPEALRKGTDEEALNFVRDVLYKRQFSGEGNASQAAQIYEDVMRKFPTLKLAIGQLFFRTPVRVFEEGIRLTPGVQFLAPNFYDDLAGKNGALRQVRAQSEAMVSLAMVSAILSLYAQGRITGDGAYDSFKQEKTRVDGPQAEPYTIKMSDGSTWSYRRFDPIATPVKILINALERRDQLRIKEAQGLYDSKSADQRLLAAISTSTLSLASAIRDASLVEGFDNFAKFLESFADPEEASWVKFMGDKLFLLVPNTLHKIARENDPEIRDPQTFWQMVEQKLLRPLGVESPDDKAAFSYDVLGNVRRPSDLGMLWNIFSTATVEERARGRTETEQFVMTELDRLQRTTGVTFAPPVRHPNTGDLDLRKIMASDGKRTLYDVWQETYRSLNPADILEPILAAPIPEGTFKVRAAKVEEVQGVIRDLQDTAFTLMMTQEQKAFDRFLDTELRKAKSQAGLFDTPRPY